MSTSIVPNRHSPNHPAVALAVNSSSDHRPPILFVESDIKSSVAVNSSSDHRPLDIHDERVTSSNPVNEVLHDTKPAFFDARKHYLARYALQEKARSLLLAKPLSFKADSDGVVIPKLSRVIKCLRNRITASNTVRVYRGEKDLRPYLAGLQKCGSVWVCPICSAKVAERRRLELEAMIKAWKAQGGEVIFLTSTVPHTMQNTIEEVIKRHNDTFSRFWRGKTMDKIRQQLLGCIGHIKVLEITSTLNGWHAHGHTLIFVKAGLNIKKLEDLLWKVWSAAFKNHLKANPAKNNPKPSRDAFHLQDGARAARYATKYGLSDLPEDDKERNWGVAQEMTRANSKIAKYRGRSGFQLLEDAANGDHHAGKLFITYGEGTFGKQQLRSSKGLKKRLLGENDLSDKELSKSIDALDILLGHIDPAVWAFILKNRLRTQLMDALYPAESTLKDVQDMLKPHLPCDQELYIDDDNVLIMAPRVCNPTEPAPILDLQPEPQPESTLKDSTISASYATLYKGLMLSRANLTAFIELLQEEYPESIPLEVRQL